MPCWPTGAVHALTGALNAGALGDEATAVLASRLKQAILSTFHLDTRTLFFVLSPHTVPSFPGCWYTFNAPNATGIAVYSFQSKVETSPLWIAGHRHFNKVISQSLQNVCTDESDCRTCDPSKCCVAVLVLIVCVVASAVSWPRRRLPCWPVRPTMFQCVPRTHVSRAMSWPRRRLPCWYRAAVPVRPTMFDCVPRTHVLRTAKCAVIHGALRQVLE